LTAAAAARSPSRRASAACESLAAVNSEGARAYNSLATASTSTVPFYLDPGRDGGRNHLPGAGWPLRRRPGLLAPLTARSRALVTDFS
jgi:hypothetical protein